MKFRLLFFLLIFLAGVTVRAQNNVIDEIVWVVGDEPILKSEVEAVKLEMQYQGVKFDGDPYCIIPEQLAIQKLYLHQADLDSITVSDGDLLSMVDRQINGYIAQYGSREKLEEIYGKSISKIREIFREQIKNTQLMKLVRNKLVGNITATPSEIRQFYSKLPTDSIPLVDADYEVEIITVEPQYSPSDIAEIKERLRQFTERVNSGTSFSTLAIMYSQDKESAKVGGELGFMGKNMLLPEFANVAFSLTDPTKVSKIVETEQGFHIIQLIEKRGDRINCRHILLKPEITATERNDALMRIDSIADLIKTGKLSFELAAQMYSYDKDTRNNGGLMVNSTDDQGDGRDRTTRFKLENLPPEISREIYTMNAGDVSKPFTLINSKGRETCAIVRLKTKTNAHKANLADDFQLLKEMVQERKSSQIIDNWIKEKQRTTYVRISDNWNHCSFKYPGWIKK